MSGAEHSSWSLGKKDAVYAGVLSLMAALVGGNQLTSSKSQVNLDVLSERMAVMDKTLQELRDPGGPVLRQTAATVKIHEDKLRDLERDLRAGVSRESMDDLKARLAEGKDSDRDMRQQIEALRATIDALRYELSQALGKRLVGPAR